MAGVQDQAFNIHSMFFSIISAVLPSLVPKGETVVTVFYLSVIGDVRDHPVFGV